MKHILKSFHIQIIFLILLILIPSTNSTTTWYSNTIDHGNTNSITGADINIEIDSKNNIHIVYRETINQTHHILKYSIKEGKNWKVTEIPTNGSSDYLSFTLDKDDKPHICFREVKNLLDWKLIYTTKVNNEWKSEHIDAPQDFITGAHASLNVDNNNILHVSYYEGLAHDLRYAKKNNNSWDKTIVEQNGNTGIYTSLALDSNNHPKIAYVDRDLNSLKLASFTGNNWIIELIDNSSNVGQGSSLKIDSNDQAHISYHDAENKTIKYAHQTNNGWQIETFDTNNNLASCTSLALDSTDQPHITYFDKTKTENEYWLKYAKKNENSTWHITVISPEILGLYTDIVLDQNNNPHIAYLGNYSLKYATTNSDSNSQTDIPGNYFQIFLFSLIFFLIIWYYKKGK